MTQTTENMNRLKLQEDLAKANGFAIRQPIFGLGTPVNQTGVKNFAKSRQDWEALPHLNDALDTFRNLIAKEGRADHNINVSDITMNNDGTVTRGQGNLLLADKDAFAALLRRTVCEEPAAAATYLSLISPERRAKEVNEWLRASDENVMKLRTRKGQLGREIFAIVSDRYTAGFEVDVLARILQENAAKLGINGDSRCLVTYDGKRANIEMLWHTDIQPETACAGEIFKAGIALRSADNGGLSIGIDSLLWRNLCLNLLIIDNAIQSHGRKRHIGDEDVLHAWIHSALANAGNAVRDFATLWDNASATSLEEMTRDIPVMETPMTEAELVKGTFRGLIKEGRVGLPGHRAENAIDQLFAAWEKEPMKTKAGIVNAITRAAHESELSNAWAGDEMEAAAGRILQDSKPVSWKAA